MIADRIMFTTLVNRVRAVGGTAAGAARPMSLARLVRALLFLIVHAAITQADEGEQVKSRQAAPPNVILILADDMGFSDLGCYGGEISTPHVDRLAAGGLRFTQFYNTARCCPTRASLLTGLYPHQAGIGHQLGRSRNGLYYGDLRDDCMTIAEALREAGYATFMSGKWHVTPWPNDKPDAKKNWPRQRGFDRFYGTLASIRSYYSPPSLVRGNTPLPPPEGDFHYTDAINENAARFIKEHKYPNKPFFLYVAHTAPHWPLHARAEDIKRYEGKYLDGWDALRRERQQGLQRLGLIPRGLTLPPRDRQALAWDRVRPEYQQWFDRRMAVYAAMIEQMDRGIGRIIDVVKRRGQLDNTLIVFLSDNGGCAEEIGPKGRARNFPRATRGGENIRLGNDPKILPGPEDTYASYGLEWANASNTPFRRFKSFVHEGGIATPLIVHLPGRVRPGVTGQVGHVMDLLPTILELADATYPKVYRGREVQPVEGKSLVPVLSGRAHAGHAALFWEHEGNRAVRQGDWKLVSRHPQPWELFNIADDRLETRNLAANQPDGVRHLDALYHRWARRVGVKPWTGSQTEIGWPDPARYSW